MNRYLQFAREAVENLIENQSARLGGKPDGPLCLTITQRSDNSYRSVGSKEGDSYLSFWFPASPMEMRPRRLDMGTWELLDRLAAATGDNRYTALVDGMADAFAVHGFEEVSGLGYLGQETQLDVVDLTPLPIGSYPKPKFKPQADLPLERLWRAAPQKMERMLKATFPGLITRRETMDFNRWCHFGFDDSMDEPSMEFNPGHVGFAMTGAALIHYWGFLFAHTGNEKSFEWAQRMADKWQRAQNHETGLMPYFFGNGPAGSDAMPPSSQSHITDTFTALSLLRARDELVKRPESCSLAEQVEAMAVRLLQGIAKYGYDETQELFPSWLDLQTGDYDYNAVWYTFPTQALKDEAVRHDPVLEEVEVFIGPGFYTDGAWSFGVDNVVPHDVSLGALWTGDCALRERAEFMAGGIMKAASKLENGFNARGQWTCSASASYILMMLNLLCLTGDSQYFQHAKKLADMELEFLARPLPKDQHEWWRYAFRNNVIDAFLRLGEAEAARAAAFDTTRS